ncbi:MAG TPA: Ig-like domain-containing protein [Gaiellaceae bacterium]
MTRAGLRLGTPFAVAVLAAVIALTMVGGAGALPPNGPSPSIVISQLYGGGGNSGAPYASDFIELFNRGSVTQSVAGWSVQYGSATGTGNIGASSSQLTALPNASIPPGAYLLVGEATGTTGAALPAPEATGSINMSATAGKVALVDDVTSLGCNGGSTPCTDAQLARVIDLVGFGTGSSGANFFEGSGPAPTLSNTLAGLRKAGGCTDSDDNAADFSAAAPAPRNSATSATPCGAVGDQAPSVTSTTPPGGATGVTAGTSPSVTFSEPVSADPGAFAIACASSGTHALTVSGGPTVFSLDPVTDFSTGEDCTVTVTAAAIHDLDSVDPPDTMAADFTFGFTVSAPVTLTPIHDIQGAAHRSPLLGAAVTTSGIVTADRSTGFYLQDPTPDADPATSEAIFVFTSSAPAVGAGDAVQVSGKVNEFRADAAGLSNTELGAPLSISVTSTGNPLPAATLIGAGGRVPPGEVIEDDATGNVETSGTFDPATDGLDFWESLEDMRVEIDDGVAVGPTNSFGETEAVSAATASIRTPRGGVVARPNDFNPERVVVDDGIVPLPAMNVGDHYTSPLIGPLDYDFDNYYLEPTQAPTVVHDGVQPESTTPAGPDELAVATFNVENLAPSDPASKFSRLANIVVGNLASPDVIAVEEVQDNSGATDNGIVAADVTIAKLTAAIQAAGGPTYDSREIDPVNDQDGGQPGGNIRVAFLFRTDRGLAFVDAPGGTSTAPDAVTPSGDLLYSPGRVDPGDVAWSSSRKPLAGEFTWRGQKVFVIANHFDAKLGDDPLEGWRQPPVFSSEAQRLQQATHVHDFVQSLLSANPQGNVVVLGDLNDYQFSQTVSILESSPLHDLIKTLPVNEQYTYDFEGNSEALDHILLSDHLFGEPFAYDAVHVNSEFADQASDHDPQVVHLTLNRAPTVTTGGPYNVDEGSTISLAATGSDPDGDDLSYAWDLDGNGTFETAGQSVALTADDGPATKAVTVQVTDPSGATATSAATVTIANVAPSATFTAPTSAVAGAPFMVSLTSPSDPSAADTTAGFQYAFDCGHGYGAFAAANSSSCAAPTQGTLSVGGEIRDKDGGVHEYRGSVAVENAYDHICSLARSFSSQRAVADLVCVELAAARNADAHGSRLVKAIDLALAGLTVRLESGHAFTPTEAAQLVSAIRALS